MNPTDSTDSTDSASTPTGSHPAQAQSPGQRLRVAREAKGLHLGMLAVTLKVPVRQLEALENDQYDAFRGPTFVRAVAQAMCRHLGIDPAPVLAGLPQSAASMAVKPAAAALSGQRSSPLKVRMRRRRGLSVSPRVLALALLMLVATLVFLWWPMPAAQNPNEVSEAWPPPTAAASDASGEEVPVAVNVPSVPVQASAPAPVDAPAASAPASAPGTVSAAASSAPVGPSAAAVAAGPASGNGLLINAIGDTWLEVRDAHGQLVVNRLLRQGESQALDLAPPFNVVIGRAHQVRATWRGKDFDLTPHTKVSTARFDIQP